MAWRGVLDGTCPADQAVLQVELDGVEGMTRFERGWMPYGLCQVGYEVVRRESTWLLVRFEFEVVHSRPGAYRKPGDRLSDAVRLDARPCHFGGVRWWFRCYLCGELRARLFMERTSWSCRVCQGLTYRIRSRHGRSARRGNKLWSGLGYMDDLVEGQEARKARRNYRRRLSRWRADYRDHPEAPEHAIQLGLFGAASLTGTKACK